MGDAAARGGATRQGDVRARLSRRQVLAATAWSVPVITVGAAAPAMAVSPPPGFLTIDASACQYSNTGLALLLHVNNNTDAPRLVQVNSLLFNTSARFVVGVQPSISPVAPVLNCTFLAVSPPSQRPSFDVAAGASKLVVYLKPGTPPTTGGVVTLEYSVPDLGILNVTTRSTVTVAPQGTTACALDDTSVNPCAPLPAGN